MVNVSFRNQQVCEEVDRAPHLRKVASANLQCPIPTCRIELLQPRCAFNNLRVKTDRLHPPQYQSFSGQIEIAKSSRTILKFLFLLLGELKSLTAAISAHNMNIRN